ncbi:hypothetical protein NQ317_004943 [Molorchus minor]|uniref:TIL domain-containing protein n=1 Tax=Molorchus minor TaxID=1323400 RepID=A0ABQ9JA96_9CUCU|nr:hypothetical protein NQ317_004943 [Molorchus minor]
MKFLLFALFAFYAVFATVNAESRRYYTPTDCGENEQYLACQPCRALSCGEPVPEVCITQCRNPGCYCAPGFLRQNGACVPEARC